MDLLRVAVTRQLAVLGPSASEASIVETGDYSVNVLLPNVVLAFSYDWRDRYIGVMYRSPEQQVKFERAAGFERLRLHDTGDSACTLLRRRGITLNQSVELTDRAAMDLWMSTLFEALKEHASDLIAGRAEGLGAPSTPPPQVKLWQKVDP